MDESQGVTRDWYRQYHQRQGEDRNDLLRNPEVLFQVLAMQAAIVSALRSARVDRRSSQVLDVGCGDGNSLAIYLQLGFLPENLHGMDILPERIEQARRAYPAMDLFAADASDIPCPNDSFDLVTASTMFVQLDAPHDARIASEMLRVTKPGGLLVIADWRYGRKPSYIAVTQRRLRNLFPNTALVCRTRGMLVPPIGRFLSSRAPTLYFMARAVFPFLTGLYVTVLRKS